MRLLTLVTLSLTGVTVVSGLCGCRSHAPVGDGGVERASSRAVAEEPTRETKKPSPGYWSGFSSVDDDLSHDGGEGTLAGDDEPQNDRRRVQTSRDLVDRDNAATVTQIDSPDVRVAQVPGGGEKIDLPKPAETITEQINANQPKRWTTLFRFFHWDVRVRVDPLLDPYNEDSIWIPYDQ